jgi:hypothetical protein
MGNKKTPQPNSRRDFFSKLVGMNKEKVKMLTPDGKLVEIDKSVLDAIKQNKKASNQEIFDWMNNPSKDQQ